MSAEISETETFEIWCQKVTAGYAGPSEATVKCNETGSCRCGAVEVKIDNAELLFSAFCHCVDCTKYLSCSPAYLCAFTPAESVQITKGQENIKTVGEKLSRCFCTECGTLVTQGPVGAIFRAVLPTVFHKYGTLIDAKYKPIAHVNYENRLLDSADDLPKFKEFTGSPQMNNDGSLKETSA